VPKHAGRLVICLLLVGGLIGGPAGAVAERVTVVRTENLAIPMSSGGYLSADLYRPKVSGVLLESLPTVVIYFPYGKDDPTRFERTMLSRLVGAGFAGLLVDIRGTGNSPGAFGFLSRREIRDGYDVVEWAARQPWSSGSVGLWGYSYPGITAALIATLQPPHLSAIVPGAAYSDPYRDIAYPGGMRMSQDSGLGAWIAGHAMVRVRPDNSPSQAAANLADAARHPEGIVPIARAALHDLYDDWWRERALAEKVREIQVPALFWSGWDDVYPRGQVLNFLIAGGETNRLVMGPWGHIGGASGGSLDFFIADSIRWFDTFLRTPNPDERTAKLASVPRVRLFDVDWSKPATYDEAYHGTWRAFPSWPEHADVALQLCASGEPPSAAAPWPLRGALGDRCNRPGSIPVAGLPVEATGGISVTHDTAKGDWANALNDPKDQRLDPAATAFIGAPLERAATITGPMRADLWARSVGTDADWIVRVVDVGPDSTRVVGQGWLRASHRREDGRRGYLWHTHHREDPLTPGEPYPFRVEIWPTSYRIPAGHRLGLLVQSADTAKVVSESGATTSTMLFGPRNPSALVVPLRTDDGVAYDPEA
jgi:putative CocE/NonD family hydrolase